MQIKEVSGQDFEENRLTSSISNSRESSNGLFAVDDESVNKIKENYARYSRPGLSKLLSAIRMDKVYLRAQGDYLFYYENGNEIPVLDFLGGFGASFFGHNYPPFVELKQQYLAQKMPYLSQASFRLNAGMLGEQLDKMLYQRTGSHFISLILNTGADAVEAALKHAEMCRRRKFEVQWQDFECNLVIVNQHLKNQEAVLDNKTRRDLSRRLGLDDASPRDMIFSALRAEVYRLLHTQGVSLSLTQSYHGKSSGALQLTFGESYRIPFKGLGQKNVFVDKDNIYDLISVIEDNNLRIPIPIVCNGKVEISEKIISNISAMFVEPLQGEGGIHSIDRNYLTQCRELSRDNEFLLVFDEIQSGMGRTGTFLYSEQLGVSADCYLLSKSLGGGIAKISAACIDQKKYHMDFDEIHSSTFAEDDYSAGIALHALRELDDKPELMTMATVQGDYIKRGLLAIQNDFPGIIDEVRGIGLLLGIAFKPQLESESFVIRCLSESKLLGHVMAGYLLHEHQIRVSATLSDNFVLRIEPSVFISQRSCDQLIQGIGRLVEILSKVNGYELVRFMLGLERTYAENMLDTSVQHNVANRKNLDPHSYPIRSYKGRDSGTLASCAKGLETVSFVATPDTAAGVAEIEKSFEYLTKKQVIDLLEKIVEVLGPVHIQTTTITSKTGAKINFRFLILMYDPFYITERIRDDNLDGVVNGIREVLDDSVEKSHRVLGLGSYTSIVTKNCTSLVTDKISLTSGNALTVGIGVRALLSAAQEKNLDLSRAVLGVMGAGGNIGSVYSEILADHVPKLILIGREGRLQKLHDVAADIYFNAFRDLENEVSRPHSVAAVIAGTNAVAHIKAHKSEYDEHLGSYLYSTIVRELGEEAPVKVSSDSADLKLCNLILTSSNAPSPVIFPELLGNQDVVLCDVSVPQDVDDSVVEQCQNVDVIRGGLVSLPGDAGIQWLGIKVLGRDISYACMAETMILGFEANKGHGSYGKISKQQVQRILQLADLHGFGLARAKVERVF